VSEVRNETYIRDLLWSDAHRTSQKQLAAEIGISPQYLSDIMGGNRPVTDRIAQHYGYHRFVGFVQAGVEGGENG